MAKREHDSRENNQNKQEKVRNTGNVFWGAFLGGMVGAAAALLFAPKSGKELRDQLNNQTLNLLAKKGEIASFTKEKAAEFTKSVVRQSTDLVQKAKNFSTKPDEINEDEETNYISIKDPETTDKQQKSDKKASLNEIEIRKKLEEAQKALDDEENRIKQ